MRAGFTVRGTMPGLNEYIRAERANRYAASKMKRAQTERVALAAAAQGMPGFTCPVEVTITWVEPNRRRDVDNVAFAKKFVLDGMVRAGVIPDDSPRYVSAISDRFAYDRSDPRVEVEVARA